MPCWRGRRFLGKGFISLSDDDRASIGSKGYHVAFFVVRMIRESVCSEGIDIIDT